MKNLFLCMMVLFVSEGTCSAAPIPFKFQGDTDLFTCDLREEGWGKVILQHKGSSYVLRSVLSKARVAEEKVTLQELKEGRILLGESGNYTYHLHFGKRFYLECGDECGESLTDITCTVAPKFNALLEQLAGR